MAATAAVIDVIDLEFTDDDNDGKSPPVSNSTSRTTGNSANVPDAKNSWKWLMNRMQQNQKKEAVTGSSRGRKRSIKTGPVGNENKPKRTKVIVTGDSHRSANPLVNRVLPPANVVSSSIKNEWCNSVTIKATNSATILSGYGAISVSSSSKVCLSPANEQTVTKCFPIASGFEKIPPRKPISSTASALLSDSEVPLFRSSFNYDDENYSDVIGWDGSDPVMIELTESTSDIGKTGRVSKRSCPFYKKIPGTRFAVDAFSYGVIPDIDVYLLSHFHSDHYMGLSRNFSKTIICEAGTGNLVHMKLGVHESCIRRLDLNRVYSVQGVKIVLTAANHCPGSVMFILRLPNGTTVLHTGDFRFTPQMLLNPFLKSLPVDCLYLDTTYCDPKYDFPPQINTISQVVNFIKQYVDKIPQTIIICGAYCIGKERVFFSVAEALDSKVYCEPDKKRILEALNNSKYNFYISSSEASAQVHVAPMRCLHLQFLSEYLARRRNVYTVQSPHCNQTKWMGVFI